VPDIHSINAIGDLSLAGNPGIAGQVLISAGPGLQAVWSDPMSGNLSGSQISAFGRIRTAEPAFLITTTSGYDLAPLIWQTLIGGAGNTAVWNAALRSVDLTIVNAGYVVRQTYQYVPYQPGRSQLLMMTGLIGAPVANVIRRLGQFDSANGLFFQESAGVKSVVARNNSVDTVVPQASWNIDPFDGTGPSGKTLDLSLDQVFVIDYAWLGTSQARFGFMSEGQIAYCHEIDFANTIARSFMQTAFLPIRYELVANAIAAAVMSQICSTISSEGGEYRPPGNQFSGGRTIAGALAVATENVLVAIRPAITFGTLNNRIGINVSSIDVFSAGASVTWRLLYYPPGSANPITGGAFAVPNANSGVEINTTGTALSLTGAIELASGYVAAAATGNSSDEIAGLIPSTTQSYPLTLDASNVSSPLTTNVGANPAYLVLSAVGVGATSAGRMNWQEIR